MAKITVPDKCMGFEMEDGTRYDSHGGMVEVNDFGHLAALQSSKAQKSDWIGDARSPYSFRRAEEKNCVCGFCAFAWQTICPKCGRDLIQRVRYLGLPFGQIDGEDNRQVATGDIAVIVQRTKPSGSFFSDYIRVRFANDLEVELDKRPTRRYKRWQLIEEEENDFSSGAQSQPAEEGSYHLVSAGSEALRPF